MNKIILVTGGAGFIGSHLCERLLNEGNQVICVDNLFTGSLENIAHMLSNQNFEFVEYDVINPLEFINRIDEIYNLACPASPVHYQTDSVFTFKTNVLGALNVLELARKTRAKVLQASTSEVYGDPLIHPQSEAYWGNVNPIGIRSCYDEGKRGAETLFFDYARQYGVKVKVVRIFNTYGPRMNPNDGRVVSNFIVQALDSQDITIYGNGDQTRSFCYVDDLVEGLIRTMGTDASFLGPVNLGNPREFTILELADLVIQHTGAKSNIVFRTLPEDDPKKRKPDITVAKDTLGWEPRIPLEKGLEKTILYFQSIISKDKQS